MKKSTFKLEKALMKEGYNFVIGIDEAGRGPLAGPVVACAVVVRKSEILNPKSEINSKFKIQNSKFFNLIRDSKTLSHKQREKLFNFIYEHFYVGVGICDHRTIDKVNILQASFLAMKKAITELNRIMNYELGIMEKKSLIHDSRFMILIDGNKKIPNFSYKQKNIIRGDKLVKSISAASIVAKVTRDRIMLKMHKKYPHYGFDKHKGYGTKLHLKRLKKHGPCRIHRKSFKPVEKLVKARK